MANTDFLWYIIISGGRTISEQREIRKCGMPEIVEIVQGDVYISNIMKVPKWNP